MSASQFDKELGWVPAIPLPFYVQEWSWRKFRFVWKAGCYECKITFVDEKEWPMHYVLNHLQQHEAGARRVPEKA